MVLCRNVVPFIDYRFGCCDLPWRGVIHHGTGKASAVINGRKLNSDLRRFLWSNPTTPTRPRAPVEVSINDNLPTSSPSGKTVLNVLAGVVGLIVLVVLYYKTIGF